MKDSGQAHARKAGTRRNVPDAGLPKHKQVFDNLLREIQSGRYQAGDRLPSEAELGKVFDASRITIAKAVNEL